MNNTAFILVQRSVFVERTARQRRVESADDRGTQSKRGTLRVPLSARCTGERDKAIRVGSGSSGRVEVLWGGIKMREGRLYRQSTTEQRLQTAPQQLLSLGLIHGE